MGELEGVALGDAAPVVYDVVRVADPAAGTEFAVTVPGNQTWEVLAVFTKLVTSAVVANRRPTLLVDDQTTTLMQMGSTTPAAASLTTRYSWVQGWGGEVGVAGLAITEPLPAPFVLPSGFRLRSSTGNIDVGDQYSTTALWIRRRDTGITPLALLRNAAEQIADNPADYLG